MTSKVHNGSTCIWDVSASFLYNRSEWSLIAHECFGRNMQSLLVNLTIAFRMRQDSNVPSLRLSTLYFKTNMPMGNQCICYFNNMGAGQENHFWDRLKLVWTLAVRALLQL